MHHVFISHTTRDQRDLALAKKIARGLALRGVQSWIAPTSIPSGDEWERGIVSGVMEKATHFLVILSAASIQAEWVLEEIKLAKERYETSKDIIIFPLVTGELADYPEKKFLSKFQSISYDDNLRVMMDAIAVALALHPAIPFNFATRIDALTQGFVGREYVFTAVQEFFDQNREGYFHIKGFPGAGKSAIMAELVNRTGYISHFIFQAQGITSTQHFLESVCSQIIQRYDLPYYTDLPLDATKDGAFFDKLLKEAADTLSNGEKMVIVIDALDELDKVSIESSGNILFLPSCLPENVYILLSSRNIPIALNTEIPYVVCDLIEFISESRDDVINFLGGVVSDSSVMSWKADQNLTDDQFIETIADKSENNFMYLKYVVGDIMSGRYQDLSIEALPQGLERYYETHWIRMGMREKTLPENRIRVVYVMCELRQPASRSMIADFSQYEEFFVQEILNDWAQFLQEDYENGSEKRYSLYHTSFRDFLHRKDIVQAAGVTIEGINGLIADNLMQAWEDMRDEF